MKAEVQNKLNLFADNTQRMKKEFWWQDGMPVRLTALLFAQNGKTVDCDAIRQCRTMIKQSTGVFSAFRGNMALCVAALLALSPNPQERLDEMLKAYEWLKDEKFHGSDYLVFSAYQMAAQGNSLDYEKIANRARAFYDGMKARHFFVTGQDDYIFVTMLGMADLDAQVEVERIESYYSRLKGEFENANSIQALAQVLTLGSADDSSIQRVVALRAALRAQKIKLDKRFTLPFLGVLALLPAEIDSIVRGICEAQAALRTKKGFGKLSVTAQELLLYAASFVAAEYVPEESGDVLLATLSTSLTNILIAQQTAMLAAMSATNAAAASSR